MRYYLKRKLNIMFDILVYILPSSVEGIANLKISTNLKLSVVILNQKCRHIPVIRIINAIRHLMLIEFHNKSEKEAYKL